MEHDDDGESNHSSFHPQVIINHRWICFQLEGVFLIKRQKSNQKTFLIAFDFPSIWLWHKICI